MHGINRRHHHRNFPCPQEKSRYVNLSINANKREKSMIILLVNHT